MHSPICADELFPNARLRQELQSMGIGLIYHERASLRAMVERGGVRSSADRTPDELARALIEIEQANAQHVRTP
jgi:hypothetical protein